MMGCDGDGVWTCSGWGNTVVGKCGNELGMMLRHLGV